MVIHIVNEVNRYCQAKGREVSLSDCSGCLERCPRTQLDLQTEKELEDFNAMRNRGDALGRISDSCG